jgi:hypothetical protein
MGRRYRTLITALSLLCLLGAIVFAASASADEVRTGTGTSPEEAEVPGAVDILGASASYDVTTGAVTLALTTREAAAASPTPIVVAGFLGVPDPECEYPLMSIIGIGGSPSAQWFEAASEEELFSGTTTVEEARQAIAGTTTTLSVTSTRLVGKPYVCSALLLETENAAEEEFFDELVFPLDEIVQTTPTEPSQSSELTHQTHTPPASTTSPPPPAPPAPPPAALAIGKTKAVKAKVGKWTKVKVTVSNSGGTAASAGTLTVKKAKGVDLQPGSGKVKLAGLAPGKSETVSFKVKLTESAKAKSTLSLSGTAGSLTAKGSVVVKLAG